MRREIYPTRNVHEEPIGEPVLRKDGRRDVPTLVATLTYERAHFVRDDQGARHECPAGYYVRVGCETHEFVGTQKVCTKFRLPSPYARAVVVESNRFRKATLDAMSVPREILQQLREDVLKQLGELDHHGDARSGAPSGPTSLGGEPPARGAHVSGGGS